MSRLSGLVSYSYTGYVGSNGYTGSAGSSGTLGYTGSAGSGGSSSSPIEYYANSVASPNDFDYFPSGADPWGVYWHQSGGYLEIKQAGWNNAEAFGNLLTVDSGAVLQLDPAGYGFLINWTSTSAWVSQGSGVYRMTGTWAGGGPTSDSGITDMKFTYTPTTVMNNGTADSLVIGSLYFLENIISPLPSATVYNGVTTYTTQSLVSNGSMCIIGNLNVSGSNNILGLNSRDNLGIGASAQLCAATYGCGNFSVGNGTLASNNTSPGYGDNIALGCNSQKYNGCGYNNTSFGKNSLYCTTNGNNNFVAGYNAMYSNTYGSHNVAIGCCTLCSNTGGQNNIALGNLALGCNTTGANNIGMGQLAGQFITSGCSNVGLGRSALRQVTTGCNNFASGDLAFGGMNGSDNVAIGFCSGGTGWAVANGIACSNISLGFRSLSLNASGCHNVSIGSQSMCCNLKGSNNIVIGQCALYSNITGSHNIAIGTSALQCNGQNTTTANANIAIGFSAGCGATGFNNILLGNSAAPSSAGSCNQIVIGTTAYSGGQYAPSATWSAISDQRDKTDIENISVGLDFLREIRPVKFTWNTRDGNRVGIPDSGFIAQELLELIRKHNVEDFLKLAEDSNPDQLYATPGKLIPVLVRAVQELADQNDNLKSELDQIKQRLAAAGIA